jgi:hypothetical protein
MHSALKWVTWIFSRLVPKDFREPLMGDLTEAYSLQLKTVSSSAAARSHLWRMSASITPLLWLRLSRATWPGTLGVGLLAFCGVALVDLAVERVIPILTAERMLGPAPLGLVVTCTMVVLIGYFAERFRRRAAIVLGAILLLVILTMLPSANDGAPVWKRIIALLLVPAAFVGRILHSLRRRRW